MAKAQMMAKVSGVAKTGTDLRGKSAAAGAGKIKVAKSGKVAGKVAGNASAPLMERTGSRNKSGKIRDYNYQIILEAAEAEFAMHGYRGASIQKIADRAGLPKANIHYYFSSKKNLYLALLDNMIHLWNDYFDEVRVEDEPSEVLDGFIRKKVELAYLYPGLSKLFAMEIIQGAPYIKEYIRAEMRTWVRAKATVIEKWIEQGRMKKVDPVHLIFLIWSSTQHYADFDTQVLTIMNHAEYERDMIDEISDFLSDMILTGCGLKSIRKPRALSEKSPLRRAARE